MKRDAALPAPTREFAVTSPSLVRIWLLPGLAMALAFGVTLFTAQREPEALTGIALLVVGLIVIAIGLHRRRVVLDGSTLRIAVGLNNAKVDISNLQPEAARIVSLDEHTELRPGGKSVGVSVSGLQAGHFKRRDGTRTFALVTDRGRVLVLPQTSGRSLLLSLEQPQALLDALRSAKS